MHLNTLTVVNSRSCVVIDYLLDVNRSWRSSAGDDLRQDLTNPKGAN